MKPPRETRSFDIEDIFVGERLRAVDASRVEALASSIDELGLMTPISIRIVDGPIAIDGEEVWSVPCLIAGAHRLEAMKKLGRKEVACYLLDADDIEAELWQIDENLARAELTTDEKRTQLRRRKVLWEERQKTGGTPRPTSLADGRASGPQHQKNFAAETAAATGLSKRQINRLLADPKPRAPTGGVEVREYVSPQDASDKRVEAVWGAYLKLTYDERQRFRDRMEENEPAIFDTTPAGRAA